MDPRDIENLVTGLQPVRRQSARVGFLLIAGGAFFIFKGPLPA